MTEITIRPIETGEEQFCERVMRALPEWFGIEESLLVYARNTTTQPTWVASFDKTPAGFITLREHNPLAAEIHCMAILREFHRKKIGIALVRFVENHLQHAGAQFLQVKTLGPSRPCEFYERTRRFYIAAGYVPLEEFPKLWPGNPSLMLVKKLD